MDAMECTFAQVYGGIINYNISITKISQINLFLIKINLFIMF